eukprot:7780953-Alexandrium_andersonii.AAC.1
MPEASCRRPPPTLTATRVATESTNAAAPHAPRPTRATPLQPIGAPSGLPGPAPAWPPPAP